VLETFSRPLFDFIQWGWTAEQEIVVANATGDLYRYFDATAPADRPPSGARLWEEQ
jgi:hypothetical protein